MKIMSKALVGTIAAGAMAVSSATPALADHRDGVNVGEIIAGALIIGGIAAVASGGNRNRDYDYRYDRAGYPDQGSYGNYGNYGNNGRYNQYGGNPRQAVEQCIYAAERQAQRYGNGRANVTDIRDVRQTRYGFEVRGRIAVNDSGRSWNGDNDRYGNDNDRYGRGWNNDNDDNRYGSGWNNDYRGWNENLRGYDSGSFKCRYDRGRVYDIDFSGVRGL
ncbi:MAG TPA: hypothetical protein VHG29_13660 [Novosphingobium sp.]|nr:hypothetical protein [Novosphingobium sp.]